MTSRLIHVGQIETLYIYYGIGSNVNLESFGITAWGQKVVFTKSAVTHP